MARAALRSCSSKTHGGGKDIVQDPHASWVASHSQRAVDSGRVSPEAAAYFQSIIGELPQMRPVVQTAKDHIGDQDPERFSAYQQRAYAEAVSRKAMSVASTTIQKAMKEQDDIRSMHEGQSTGENYWMESGVGLNSMDVPPEVKEDIFDAMKRDRPKDSPAFGVDDPNPGSPTAGERVLSGEMMRMVERGEKPW